MHISLLSWTRIKILKTLNFGLGSPGYDILIHIKRDALYQKIYLVFLHPLVAQCWIPFSIDCGSPKLVPLLHIEVPLGIPPGGWQYTSGKMLRTIKEKVGFPTFVLTICTKSFYHHSGRISTVYGCSSNVLWHGLRCAKFPMIDQGHGGTGIRERVCQK